MKRIGIVSYNIHANFTNYGSALQSWALSKIVTMLGYRSVLIDYCPDVLLDKDPLDPFKNSWDKDSRMKKMIYLSMPAIEKNYKEFDNFYTHKFNRSSPYTRLNFDESVKEVDSYLCGADTIFSPDEFNLDDGYLANYSCMRNNSISYAASFGDPHFSEKQLADLNCKLKNFKALGIRENLMLDYVKTIVNVPVKRVIDPTLLLDVKEYKKLATKRRFIKKDYLLYYSRRYNSVMENFVEKLAKEKKLEIVEISLQATNVDKGHIMFYEAGVEDFLSLIIHSKLVVTNSYHGLIFSVLFKKEFAVFSRSLCDSKINELLLLLGINGRLLVEGNEQLLPIDYESVFNKIEESKKESITFLKNALALLGDSNDLYK